MFCDKCGTQVADNERFCPNCGAPQNFSADSGAYGGYTFDTIRPQSKPANSNTYNILVIIAAALMALGTLLPCYTISFFGRSESLAYIEGDGIFILLAAVAVVIMFALKIDKFSFIPSGIATLVLIYFTSQASDIGFGSYGIGFYVMWIGTLASLILPFIKKQLK